VRSLAEASTAVRVSLMLVERGGRALRLRAARGLAPGLVGKVRCLLGAGLAGRVAALGRPMVGEGTKGGPRAYPGRSYVVLPLGKEGRCEGVVSLTGLPEDAIPDAATLRSWARLCRRAGVAIAGARRLRRAEALSSTDALTGLPNRRAFERALGREIERARRSGLGLAVGLLDVDRFKAVNDQYGHQVGDGVLAQVARRLAGSFRESDLVARWGGEEFAVLLPGIAPDGLGEAVRALERARRAVGATPLPLGPGLPTCPVTVSGGLALYPAAGADAVSVVRAADQALYAAKDAGRNNVKTA
jgi:diguanylate cyclase (GGDEF)-like protein